MSTLHPKVGSAVCAAGLAALTLAGAAAPAQAAVGDVTEFGVTAGSKPQSVAAGPDDNLWVTGYGAGAIFRVSTSGAVTSFPTLTPGAGPRSITAGPDGNLWYTMGLANKIGRITTAGLITEYAVPTPVSQPAGIAAGPDGALWFTESSSNKIGRITTAGVITEYAIPTPGAGPVGITAGPEGSNRMYFTEIATNKVGFITMAGAITETVTLDAGSMPYGIATIGGSVWFVEMGKNYLSHLVSDTTVSHITVGTATQPTAIAAGPDGSIWVTASNTSQVWRFDGDGAALGQYALPTPASLPLGIAAGPDGNMWVAAADASKVDRIASGQVPTVLTAPQISPLAGVVPGTVLNPTNGTWKYQPSTYSYQWQRCTAAAEASCANIAGATATAYTASADDNLKYLRVGVTAVNLSGNSTPAYSAFVSVGIPTPTPTPTPGPATGPIASIGNGATAELVAPSSQRRGRSANYGVLFSASDVQGKVTLVFKYGSHKKTVAGLIVTSGAVHYKWKVSRYWHKGTTTVTATFTPTAGSAYSPAAMRDRVKIR